MGGHNSSSVLCAGASLEQTNRERGASWEGCNRRNASTGCSAPIPQCHRHHHITRRDAWGRGTLSLIGSLDILVLSPFHITCIQSPVILKSNAWELGTSFQVLLLYTTEYKNTFNPPPPHPSHCHIKEIGL